MSVAGRASRIDTLETGGETLWLDNDGRLMASVTFSFGTQAVREGLENRVAWFSERAPRCPGSRRGHEPFWSAN
jgi:hypothetical protein